MKFDMKETSIFKKTIDWINSKHLIRLALLTGSFTDGSTTDEFSDLDISLFCSDPQQLTDCNSWLKDIDNVWVVIPEKYRLLGASIPTRLVIFKGGKKVDFSFFSLDQLKVLEREGLPDAFNIGYEVLVDKDHLGSKLPSPEFVGFREPKPSKEDFHHLIKEFWFEVYHVAKYLYRQDLWSVQFRFSGIYHKILIKMVCWNEAGKNQWDYSTHSLGKRLDNWVGKDTWNTIRNIFPHFDAEEGWIALREMTKLFKRLSHETSKTLGYDNLLVLEGEMRQFITKLENKSRKDNSV
ncbi:MAG: aminoglycoside 6-adenylyltransferase [Chlamydiota bacterium]